MERLIRKTTAEQVADRIEVAILTGEFDRESRLPSEHQLARDLGVGRVTVREGLQRLIARGLLMAVPGIGTFVASTAMSRSVERVPSIYMLEKAARRKLELLVHYLDYRRMVAAEVLPLVCRRCSPDQIQWVEEALLNMVNTGGLSGDSPGALDAELRVLFVAAEKTDAYFVWLTLHTMRTFLRVARRELASVVRVERLRVRALTLLELLRQRDPSAIEAYVREDMAREDAAWIAALEKRGREGQLTATAVPASIAVEPAVALGPAVLALYPPPPPADEPSEPVASTDGDGAPPSDPMPAIAPPVAETVKEEGRTEPPPVYGTWRARPDLYPRTDPRAWHPWSIDWYQRNIGCNPWDIEFEEPPGTKCPWDTT